MAEFNPQIGYQVQSKLLEKFKNFDKDGDGYVSASEFQNSIITEYQKKHGQEEITRTLPNGQKVPSGEIIPNHIFKAQMERFAQFNTAKEPSDKGLNIHEFSNMYWKETYEELSGSKCQSAFDELKTPQEKRSFNIEI